MKRRTSTWVLAAALLLLIPLSVRAAAEQEEEYRVWVMKIARYHLLALDHILTGKVDQYEHVEAHARGLRSASQIIPHSVPDADLKGLDEAQAKEKRLKFQAMIELSQERANDMVKAARDARRTRNEDDEKAQQNRKELKKAFRNLHKACWECHNMLHQ